MMAPTIAVADVDVALAWYIDVLGARLAARAASSATVMLPSSLADIAPCAVELAVRDADPPGAAAPWIWTNGLSLLVSDIEVILEAERAFGVMDKKIAAQPLMHGPYAGGRWCSISDRDGNEVVLTEPPASVTQSYQAARRIVRSEEHSYALRFAARALRSSN